MKHSFLVSFALFVMVSTMQAQQFFNKGSIEFEVITNVKKTMSNESYFEDLKATMPTFKIAYYSLTFANNKSVYKFDHYDEKKAKVPEYFRAGEDENNWYNDFNMGETVIQKSQWGSLFNLKDSIKTIHWKITNESRLIAGFNCRKAVGIIMDSVYVFAFYTDEITTSGGPCSINGLPGMIMGVTIPRLYVSMMATKLNVNDVNESSIKPTSAKKYYTSKELDATVDKKIKDWSANREPNEDFDNAMNQARWNIQL
jgi:GLPGLI family protein